MDVENVNDRPTVSSSAALDWAAAFQSPEFCSGLQTVMAGAIAKTIGACRSTESSVTALEQMGEVCPTATVSAPEAHETTEDTLTTPSFIGISGSPSLTKSSAAPQGDRSHAKTASELHVVLPPHHLAGRQHWPQSGFYFGTRAPPYPSRTCEANFSV